TYDRERLNSHLMPFRVGLIDNQGKPSRATVVALIATASAYGSGNPTREFRVDYGPDFLQEFDDQKASDAVRQTEIKQEMEVDLPQAGASSASAGLRRELGRTLHMAAQVDEPGPGEEVETLASPSLAVPSWWPTAFHPLASSRVTVSLQAQTLPHLESAQAAPKMLEGGLRPAPPSRVQATADPVSRKRALGPDQPGEGPRGIKRGGQTVRQLLQSLRAGGPTEDRTSSLQPPRAELSKADARRFYESKCASARGVALELAPRKWPNQALAERLMATTDVCWDVATAISRLNEFPDLQRVMRLNKQQNFETDRAYAHRLFGCGARADELSRVFRMHKNLIIDMQCERGAVPKVPGSRKTVFEAAASSDLPPFLPRRGKWARVRTEVRSLQPWQEELLKAVPRLEDESPSAHARKLVLEKHRRPGEMSALDLAAMCDIGERTARATLRLATLPELSGLMHQYGQQINETDFNYAQRLLGFGARPSDLALVFRSSKNKLLFGQTRARAVDWLGAPPGQEISGVKLPTDAPLRPILPRPMLAESASCPPGWEASALGRTTHMAAHLDEPPQGEEVQRPGLGNVQSVAQAPSRRSLPWQAELLRAVPHRPGESNATYARRLVLEADLKSCPLSDEDIKAMSGVDSFVATCIRQLAELSELKSLMRLNEQEAHEADLDYAQRLEGLGANVFDLCTIFQTTMERMFAPDQ
ncbi:hypothetical protein SAMN05216359_110199, partial [Roseateles sp. YR242]|uniref:hypothetical protein n=1 Tax=Roseateles sp. YR242 TaxID=1855305 RepID=UPI0008C2F26D